MIQTLLTATLFAIIGGAQVYQFQQTKSAVCSLTKQYSMLSNENQQDLANSILLQQEFEQLASNIQKVDLKTLTKTIQDLKKQVKTQQQQYQQQQNIQQQDSKQFKNLMDTISQLQKTVDNMKTVSSANQQSTNTTHTKIKSDFDNLSQSMNTVQTKMKADIDRLQQQFTQLLQQQGQLTNVQKTSPVQTPQQSQDSQALSNQFQDLKKQIDAINTKIATLGQVNSAMNQTLTQLNIYSTKPVNPGNAKINITPTGNQNPDSNGLYQLTNDKASDSILSARVQQDTTGSPYTSYDHSNVTGWSSGLDSLDSNNYSIKNNWIFNGKPQFTIDTTGNVGIGDSVVRPQVYKLDVAGNSKFGQVNVNTSAPGPGKINVTSSGAGNPDVNSVYVRAPDQNTDAILTARVPNGSKGNPALTFDHDGVAGYQMGMSTATGNPFVIARNWNNLGSDPAFKLEPDGGITFFTENMRVCKRGGDYQNCKTYNHA